MNDITLRDYFTTEMDNSNDMYKDYAESAAFLWYLRSVAVTEPNYNTAGIAELELRIEAQLDGLLTSIESAWSVCEDALGTPGQAGEVFTATVVAFRSRDMEKIKISIAAGLLNDETFKGVVSALGWLSSNLADPWIIKFLNSKDLDHKYLALSVCSVRRHDPGYVLTKLLQRDDCLQHKKLYARALRLVGELRRQDLMPELNKAMSSENEEVVFWAQWASVLLGNKVAVNHLQSYISKEGLYQDIAIQLVFRTISIEQGRSLISELVKNKSHMRTVIKAVGVLGDPHAVNWLITLMKEPVYACLAAEAFTNITGIDLEAHQLSAEPPEDVETISDYFNSKQDDATLFMDEDENLLWPDVHKVIEIWQKYGNNFIVGQRYFMGKTITVELLKNKIINATQRQRRGAALELALIDTEHYLVNVHQRVLA